MMKLSLWTASGLLFAAMPLSASPVKPSPLIVVENRGGIPAQPYYEAISPQPDAMQPPAAAPSLPVRPASVEDMLPVRSLKLTPGAVATRPLDAPGLQPFFLVGDDDISRSWLRQRAGVLRERGAVGLAVNVDTAAALTRLRNAAPGVQLVPVAADDLVERLGIQHYPVLITSTGIEQ